MKISQGLHLVHIKSVSSPPRAIYLNQLLFCMYSSTCLIRNVAVTSWVNIKYSGKKKKKPNWRCWGSSAQLHNCALTEESVCLVSKLFRGQTDLFLYNRIDRTASTSPVCWPKHVISLQRKVQSRENEFARDVWNPAVKWLTILLALLLLKPPDSRLLISPPKIRLYEEYHLWETFSLVNLHELALVHFLIQNLPPPITVVN